MCFGKVQKSVIEDELKFYNTDNMMKALSCDRIRDANFLCSMQSIKEIEYLKINCLIIFL